ncbi:MAG TPA: amidase family protein, partial [Ramlibacter sp.]
MPSPLEEATIATIHAAYRGGTLTATQLVRGYLARIEAYDRQGPTLRAMITINPAALEEAMRLDAEFKAHPDRIGPLHGIPIVLKDNFNTKDMPTTGGSVALKDFRPSTDAFTVDRLRRAGAIILGKANMTEFARGGISVSSLGGQVLNPYDLTRTPGGSSGGTGAAVAANFAAVGTGSDTGQSIRSPASACSLVGVRPTRGLISRAGVMPNSFIQDEVGPIARTVEDAARMLDVMVGYDPLDPITALGVGKAPASYLAALDERALQGAHIGVMANLHGTQERHA